MTQSLRLLLIDDNPADRALARREIERAFPSIMIGEVKNQAEFVQVLAAGDFDAAITDFQLHWNDGLNALSAIKQRFPFCPVLMFTATGTEETAVEAMKRGLDDYVLKSPRHYARLPVAIQGAIERANARRRAAELELERERLLASEHAARLQAEDGQRRLRFLADASRILSSSLDETATLQALANVALPTFADYCIVDLVEPDGSVQQVAVAHVDPALSATIVEMRRRYPFDMSLDYGVPRVLRTGEPELVNDLPPGWIERVARDAEHAQLIRRLHPTSYLVLPMRIGERALGALSLVLASAERRYDSTDLEIGQDLARRAALALDNARLYLQAQRAVQVRDEFMITAAHELRTPMTSILGFSEVLYKGLQQPEPPLERLQRSAATLRDQAQRLHRLISETLDMSRIQAGRFELQRQPLDLCELAAQVVKALEALAAERAIELGCEQPSLIVMGDAGRLEQVIQNLVQNAVKYSPSHSTIRLVVMRDGDEACLAVIDHGIGIPAEARPHLFQRFYRASNVDPRATTGFGIGLYIAHEIVAQHGGRLDVDSTEGEGSTFTIRLPLIKDEG